MSMSTTHMTHFMQAGAGMHAPTTYMALGAVLTFLLFLTLWREMATTNMRGFFPRSFAALAFFGSRVLVIIFSASLITTVSAPPVMYMVVNLVCLYLAMVALPEAVRTSILDPKPEPEETPGAGAAPEEPAAAPAIHRYVGIALAWWHAARERYLRNFHVQAGLSALGALILYLALPHSGWVGDTPTAVLSFLILGATVRVVVEMFRTVDAAEGGFRRIAQVMVISLTASWLFVVLASLQSGTVAAVLLQGSRIADIFALIMGLLGLQTLFLVQSYYHKNRADDIHDEAERAKAEVQLLNRVATDLYEDSSSMIQRQQDRFRALVARVDSLEKILQIGIRIQQHRDVKQLLQSVAELVRDELGFETVIIRTLNENTQCFETRSYVGPNDDIRDAVLRHRLPAAEYEKMVESRFRISRSYFFENINADPGRDEAETAEGAEAEVLGSNQWAEIDRIIIPLLDDDDSQTVGYISVEEPNNSELSVVDAIDNLESIATLTVVAMRQTNYYREVEDKNEKLKLYTEKLSSLNKLKSNFVATISHEFRTPLTSIKAYCETLLKNVDNVDRDILKEFLHVIDEESNRLMSLIEDILDFSQMESGAVRFERAICDLKQIVDEVAGDLEEEFARKRITLRKDVPRGPAHVRAETELMKQMMSNLIQNAVKFTPDDGNVLVLIEDETVAVRIMVQDDGIGIPEDQLESIFDHFHQADGSSTREHGGAGMGLAICKNIVEWHDGKIWVENVSSRGARFVVVIPKKQAIVRSHVMNLDGTMRRFEAERYLEVLVEMVAELMSVKTASIMLLSDDRSELRIESAIGLDAMVVEDGRETMGEGIAGKVALEGKPYLVEDISRDERVDATNNDFIYDSRSFMSVPITLNDEVIGVINVSNPAHKSTFDQGDCDLLMLFTQRIALALDKLMNFASKSGEFEEIQETFKSMLDARRYIDDRSADAMSSVLQGVAVRLGLDADETATLRYVYNVYDLGLARIGHHIIKQPRPLSDKDRRSVEQHTIIGTDMLRNIEKIPAVRDAVLYHHENFDGTGYPGSLAGEEIPLMARIIRVTDTFRALVSHRPYQKQYTVEEAVEVLRYRSGTFFDPRIVAVFVDALKGHEDRFLPATAQGAKQPKATVGTTS